MKSTSSQEPVASGGGHTWIAVAIITVVAAWLRLANASTLAIRGDEFGTLRGIRFPAGELLSRYSEQLTMHLYILGMKAWVAIAGSSALALKVPSLLAGIAIVPLVCWLGSRRGERDTALVAGVLIALNVTLIQFSRMARVYSVLAVVILLGMFLYERAVRERRGRDWLVLGLLNAVALSLSLVSVCYLAVQALHAAMLILSERSDRRRALAGLGASIALSASLALAFYWRALDRILTFREWYAGAGSLRFDWVDNALGRYYGSLTLPFLTLLVVGAIVVWRRDRSRGGLLLLWAVFPWLFFVAAGSRHAEPAFARFLLPSVPAQLLLIAGGAIAVAQLLPRMDRRRAAIGALVVLTAGTVLPSGYAARVMRDASLPYVDVLARIGAQAAPTDLITSCLLGMDRPDLLEEARELPPFHPVEQIVADWPAPAEGRLYLVTRKLRRAMPDWSRAFRIETVTGRSGRSLLILSGESGSSGGQALRQALKSYFEAVVAPTQGGVDHRRYFELSTAHSVLADIARADGDRRSFELNRELSHRYRGMLRDAERGQR